jgi:hypothetical protein
MRSAIAGPVTPLLGSLGLHGGIVLTLLIAVRQPTPTSELHPERPDAWAGNAVEVDAVATPDATASIASVGLGPATDRPLDETAAASLIPTDSAVVKTESSSLDRPASKPASARPHLSRAPKVTSENAARARATPASDAPAGTGATTPASGSFGGEGLPPGVRSLPSAFTRAITPATAADPIWQTLPTGGEHPFTIAIEVDADGHISGAEILKARDGSAAELQAVHLRERAVALLGAGLFALRSGVGAGRESCRITVTLSDRPVRDEDDPAQLTERGFDPPRGASPGRAYFTLTSGRHFEAKVQILAHP